MCMYSWWGVCWFTIEMRKHHKTFLMETRRKLRNEIQPAVSFPKNEEGLSVLMFPVTSILIHIATRLTSILACLWNLCDPELWRVGFPWSQLLGKLIRFSVIYFLKKESTFFLVRLDDHVNSNLSRPVSSHSGNALLIGHLQHPPYEQVLLHRTTSNDSTQPSILFSPPKAKIQPWLHLYSHFEVRTTFNQEQIQSILAI